jgi:aerobic-type carbon monoxide dehydrogenase small subunit (CoxS/CutS family)
MPRELTLHVNGRDHVVTTDDDRPLLDVLREDLALNGAKYGCGEGECGACTVLIDGVAVRSCVTTAAEVGAGKIRTIEGLADGDALHPVQQAFIEKQAMQCGYCVPGQISGSAGRNGEAVARRDRRGHDRQHLPLLQLPKHPRGRRACRTGAKSVSHETTLAQPLAV